MTNRLGGSYSAPLHETPRSVLPNHNDRHAKQLHADGLTRVESTPGPDRSRSHILMGSHTDRLL
jgi:hypothetical protein